LWRKRRAKFLEGKRCEWCGSDENLVIHHPQPSNSLTNSQYESFEGTMVLCKKCHFQLHRGLVICRVCKKRYHKPRYDSCWECFTKTPRGKEVEFERQLLEYRHPWCGQVFKIQTQWWEIEANPTMCCIEHCERSDINTCEIARTKIKRDGGTKFDK
jgi:hypothetical protein